MKVIAVINQKGGVGKTTTAYTVATGLHLRGYKTLSIDLDQQENFTFTINVNADKSIYDVLTVAYHYKHTHKYTYKHNNVYTAKYTAIYTVEYTQ